MSTIKIYKTNITPDRNALVDDLGTYLASLEPTYANSTFQYIQLSTDISIKVDLEQEMQAEEIGNYVDLLQDGKHFYFFIMKSVWKSTKTVELSLSIDSVNTFKGDFTFNKKTNIIRQHKNRIKTITYANSKAEQDHYFQEGQGEYTLIIFNDPNLIGKSTVGFQWTGEVTFNDPYNKVEIRNLTFNPENGDIIITWFEDIVNETLAEINDVMIRYVANQFVRDIDTIPEGINAPLYHKSVEDTVITDNDSELNWYLIYKNQNDPDPDLDINPVDCFICADEPISISTSTDIVVDRDVLEYGKYYLIYPSDNGNTVITFRDSYGNAIVVGTDVAGNDRYGMVITKTQSGFSYFRFTADGQTIHGSEYDFNGSVETTSLKLETAQNYINARAVAALPVNPSYKPGVSLSTITTIGQYTINSIKSLVRTDPKLIKVIKLPYCPIQDITDTAVVALEQGFLRLVDQNIKFDNTFDSNVNVYDVLAVDLDNILYTELRDEDDYYESKLYNSELYTPKFIYDSFGFNFELQNLANTPTKTTIDFTTSSTINSAFMFTFPEYKLKYSTQDYDNILTVRRNNEITLYNNAYINYIKTGYNYDVKNKNTQIATSWISAGIQIAGSVLGFVAGGATGGLSSVAAIGLATSATATIASNISNDIKAERSLQQKLDEARNQATSVSGSDDIDLLTKYSGNKAKLAIYKASDNIMKHAADLFYYCGYAANKQDIPNTTSRYWFNYIQCEPVFNEEETSIYKNYLDDIKARYNAGITVYHAHNNNYDWSQTHENWEIDL